MSVRKNSILRTTSGRGLREDWSRLVGHTVEMWRNGELVATGVVEQATDDDKALWIAAEGNRQRRLYDKFEGFEAWV